jgi:alginate O-acetyltransferase complex protein AlgI
MSFSQIEFIIFFAATITALSLSRNNTVKKVILLLSNFYFYAYFSYYFFILLVIAATITFAIGNAIVRSKSHQKLLLSFGIILNLSVLAYFKYYNFFIESILSILPKSQDGFHLVKIIVPLGVSFYIFRFISYLSDVYKSKQTNITIIQNYNSLFNFLIYGTFFPIIISGPISRACHFIPQLENLSLSPSNIYKGYRLFVIGLFLKIFLADRIAPFVNYYFENYEVFNSLSAWLATTAYTLQIYFDFAGYSNMAIGLSLMLGLNIESNFNFPYISTSLSDFWKRWHITLSEWIRDYIYIPIGGNRKGYFFKFLNLLIAMTLCGLWHGAAVTFIVWGFFHGLLLIANHFWKDLTLKLNFKNKSPVYLLLSWIITFFCVSMLWVIFRAETISQALRIIKSLFLFSNIGIAWYQPFVIFVVLSTVVFHILYLKGVKLINLPIQSKLTPTILFCLLWLTIVFYPQEFQPFVYGQF